MSNIEFEDSVYYTGPTLSGRMILEAEHRLGYKLPTSYLDVLRVRNGGVPTRRHFPTSFWTPSAPGEIQIRAILGIGGTWGIDGSDGLGSADMIREWGYPDIGIVICDTPSGGHDTVMLDYREGRTEPAVAYVEEDLVPRVIADTFAEFIAGLEGDDEAFEKRGI